ncbi:MAG: pitrilysin family protein [Phycisphaerales bacterium]
MSITYKEHTLPNGLKIVGEVDPDAHSAAVGFFVGTGARDEAGEIMGVSHFLEHMMFKGTEKVSADALNRIFDEIGARNNAYTAHEVTCFYAHVLPESLARATDTLAEMMRPALRQSDFDTEKNVILEEIAMYKDDPFWVLYEACLDAHFGGRGLGHRVLGTPETITALTRDQMLGYFEQRYSADNTIVALAGRVDFDDMVRRVGEACSGWQTTAPRREPSKPVGTDLRVDQSDERVGRAYTLMVMNAPGVEDERRYAAALLAQILGGPNNSRLHWALIEPGLAEDAQASYDPHDGVGELIVYASGDPERADEIGATLVRELDALADSLEEDDLARLRNKLATSVTLSGEKPHDRMQRLGRLWTMYGKYRSLEEELERIQAVTLDDLRELCAAYPFSPRTVGRLLPG